MAIDELAARTRAAGRFDRDAWLAETTLAGERALLVKPQSFMNRSGEPVVRLLGETGGTPADLVVISDDVALPLGRLRVRPAGSDGGHNGLGSLIASLGTEAFARVRIGVGVEATGQEAAGQEATRQEATRQEATRQEATRQEATRQELGAERDYEAGGAGGSAQHPPRFKADFVLGDFLPEELLRLREVIGLAADAVACLVAEGAASAMNRFNGRTV